MIDLLRYKPNNLKIEVKKIQIFNYNFEKKGKYELEKILKKIQKEDISLNEVKIFLVNIKKIFTFFEEEEIFKLINNIKITKTDSKVNDLERYIYYSILEMQNYDRFDYLYTYLNKLGKKLYRFMSYPETKDSFRVNFQKTFQNNYNKSFQEFLIIELRKEVSSNSNERFYNEFLLNSNSKLYLEIKNKI